MAMFACKRLSRYAVLFSLLATLAEAQIASRVAGAVHDTSDAPMPGVKVTITDVNRGTSAMTTTNEAGRDSFPNMGVGDYEVSAEFTGFKKASSARFKLDVNATVDLDIRMEVGQMTERVEVTADASLLQTSDSQVSNLIDNKKIVELPLQAR